MSDPRFESFEFLVFRADNFDRIFFGVHNGYIETDDIEEYIQDAYIRSLYNPYDETETHS